MSSTAIVALAKQVRVTKLPINYTNAIAISYHMHTYVAITIANKMKCCSSHTQVTRQHVSIDVVPESS